MNTIKIYIGSVCTVFLMYNYDCAQLCKLSWKTIQTQVCTTVENRSVGAVKGLFAPADIEGIPICIPGPLDQPISEEICSALGRLCNQRTMERMERMEYQGNY